MLKRIGFPLVLAFMIVWLSAGAAWAATSYYFIMGKYWRAPQETVVSLGSLIIEVDPLLEGRHEALFELPVGFEIGLPGKGYVPGLENPDVEFSYELVGDNEFLGIIIVPTGSGKNSFELPIKSTIPDGTSGDIELRISSIQGQLVDGVVTVGTVVPGEVKIESSRVGTIKNGKAGVVLTVTENMAGLLRKGSPLKFTLPEGFEWGVVKGSLEAGKGLDVRPDVDGRVLELVVRKESTKRSEYRVEAEVCLVDAGKARAGEVRADIEGLKRLSARTILVARYEPVPVEPEPEPVRTVVFTLGRDTHTVNGIVKRMDAAPYLRDGRTYLPLRYVGVSLGVSPDGIEWDGRTATLKRGDITVKVSVGSKTLLVNDTPVQMDVVPEIAPPGRVMLPYRFIGEAFGASVHWNPTAQTVTLEEGSEL